jgi:hypothetical protein
MIRLCQKGAALFLPIFFVSIALTSWTLCLDVVLGRSAASRVQTCRKTMLWAVWIHHSFRTTIKTKVNSVKRLQTFLCFFPSCKFCLSWKQYGVLRCRKMARHFNPQNADDILIVSPCFLCLSLHQHQQPHSLHFCKNTPF